MSCCKERCVVCGGAENVEGTPPVRAAGGRVRVSYRGVLFGVYSMASLNGGHTAVRPLAVSSDSLLAGLLAGEDVSKCVGKAFKEPEDDNSDEFGVHQAACRCYRMLVGLAKVRVNKVLETLDEMQRQSRADQDKVHSARYPRAEKPMDADENAALNHAKAEKPRRGRPPGSGKPRRGRPPGSGKAKR